MIEGIFVLAKYFFSCLKRFSFTFTFSTMAHILLARENGIFIKQCRGCFDVNGTYCFESVGLLYSIQVFLPLLFIIISKKDLLNFSP